MANTKLTQRQKAVTVVTPLLTIANIGAGNGYDIPIPPDTYVSEIYLDTLTAFDGTTNTGTVSDGTTTFVNAQDLKSTGRETDAVPGKYYPNGGTISITLAQTGTATVGQAIGVVTMVGLHRADEIYTG
jgi:hypothetical protein